MSTLGKTATPTTANFGYYSFGNELVGMPFTTSQSGLYSSVTFWAAGSGTLKIHGVIWDAAGNVLAFGPGVNTSGGAAGGVGATSWYTDTFASPLFIPGGTPIFIGWQADSGATVYWAYNGNDHSPNFEWKSGSGSGALSFAGAATPGSSQGATAVYATYSQAGVWTEPSGTVTPPVALWCNPGTGPTKVKGVWVSNGSGGVKQIW